MTDFPTLPDFPAKPGTNTFLIGGTGSGKTHCIRTFLERGITPFILATEPGIGSTLGDLPPDQCHWHYIAPAQVGWGDLIDSAKKINTLSYKALAEMSDVNKRKYAQFLDFLEACNNFTCDRTGESFGDVSTWGNDRAFVVDSLTGLSIMAMNLVVGSKPTKSQSDWGVAMDNLHRVILKMVTDTNCWFVMTAHPEREKDEVTGGVSIMASTLGQKLAPKLPQFFDDVIFVQRKGTAFTWSTAAVNADLKARNLPIREGLTPSFVPIIDAWKKGDHV